MAGEGVAGAGDGAAAAAAGAAGLAGEEWVAGAAAFADLGFDGARAEFVAQTLAAVAAVGPDLLRLVAGGAERVDQRQQVGAFVFVAGAERDLQRPAAAVDGEVVFARGERSVDGTGPG